MGVRGAPECELKDRFFQFPVGRSRTLIAEKSPILGCLQEIRRAE
jgi:hypothetical protein